MMRFVVLCLLDQDGGFKIVGKEASHNHFRRFTQINTIRNRWRK